MRCFCSCGTCWIVAPLLQMHPFPCSWLCTPGGGSTGILSKGSLGLWHLVGFGQWKDLAGYQWLGGESGQRHCFPAGRGPWELDSSACDHSVCWVTLWHSPGCSHHQPLLCSGPSASPHSSGFWALMTSVLPARLVLVCFRSGSACQMSRHSYSTLFLWRKATTDST